MRSHLINPIFCKPQSHLRFNQNLSTTECPICYLLSNITGNPPGGIPYYYRDVAAGMPDICPALSLLELEETMAHFPLIEYDDLTDPKSIEVYDEILAELGFGIVPNLFKSMATNPDILEANWKKFRSTILQGDVPRTLKEMIGVAISQANNSEYALKVHLHGLSALGISEEILHTLVSDFANCPLPAREKAAISFGLQAATHPHDVTGADFQNLRELGLDDAEIFEIISASNLFTAVNQYTDAIALEVDKL